MLPRAGTHAAAFAPGAAVGALLLLVALLVEGRVLGLSLWLGGANYVVFLDLQRKVATANGIQLLFLTGVGDMKAVGRYPNIIRMRNTANGSDGCS